jgi:transcription factor IIIB 90 kDa subunit
MGQFLGETEGRHLHNMIGFNRQSREITTDNATKRISLIADQLRIPERLVDSAVRVFKLALDKSFTKGRNARNVAAACLYTACRLEKTSHLLLDFSEVLKVKNKK